MYRKDIKTIDEVMQEIDPAYRYNWCDNQLGECFCRGCVNYTVYMAGFNREDWEEWVNKNPQPPADTNSVYYFA